MKNKQLSVLVLSFMVLGLLGIMSPKVFAESSGNSRGGDSSNQISSQSFESEQGEMNDMSSLFIPSLLSDVSDDDIGGISDSGLLNRDLLNNQSQIDSNMMGNENQTNQSRE